MGDLSLVADIICDDPSNEEERGVGLNEMENAGCLKSHVLLFWVGTLLS